MADEAALAAQSIFEALAESAPDAIVTIDADSTIISANSAVTRVFGYAPAQLVGQPLTILMPERLRARHQAGLAQYLASGTKHIPWTGVQLPGLRKDGREIPVEISFGEFIDPHGRRVFSGFIRDNSTQVAQQAAIERALADAQLQEQLLASVEQAVVSTDVAGRVLTWNEHAESLYGWSADDAIGHMLTDLLPGEKPEEMKANMERLRRGERVSYERQVRRRDGELIWIAAIAAPIRDAEGRVTRIVGTSSDISERRRLQAQFLQAQKMDAIGRLAGGVAHDFNNLLTIISAHAEFLNARVEPGSEAHADVREIAKATQRAAVLVRQLLAFSRQQLLEQIPVQVNPIITNLQAMLSRVIGQHITLSVELGDDVPVVLADPGQLEQVVLNLVVNARDAMPDGGTIRIASRRMVVPPVPQPHDEVLPAGSYAAISVTDDGCGMSPGVRSRIFEPFFTTKEPGKGTGLGLATVYGIVKQSLGFIDVRTAPGKGTTFTIYLPATDRTAYKSPPSGSAVVAPGSETILLVEDQEEVRRLTGRILRANGYNVIEAGDGMDALAILEAKARAVSLVLTDAIMPRMNGPALMRAARGRWPNLPFVIMSGFTADAVIPDDATDANSTFVQKPFASVRLLAAIREAIERAKTSPRA
jgi:two-component system cell cycle sensor histidine kinase/response regulator CckA